MVRAKWAVFGLAGAIALAGTGVVAASLGPFNKPIQQPIAFPHDMHADSAGIPCMYCHFSADRSVDAGIPPVQVCAGCHAPAGVPLVRADRPEVKKLVAYWQQQRPIPWVRIYKLPDHVHFPHMRHVHAGLECQECHGQVQTIRYLEKPAQPLHMGWCINCHREKKVRTDCFVCHY